MKTLRKLELMHAQFGRCEGHTCGECRNLRSIRYRGMSLRKCAVYGLTHSEASDWAKRWTACGMFGKEYAGPPVIESVRRVYTDTPLENQISMLEEQTYENLSDERAGNLHSP